MSDIRKIWNSEVQRLLKNLILEIQDGGCPIRLKDPFCIMRYRDYFILRRRYFEFLKLNFLTSVHFRYTFWIIVPNFVG